MYQAMARVMSSPSMSSAPSTSTVRVSDEVGSAGMMVTLVT